MCDSLLRDPPFWGSKMLDRILVKPLPSQVKDMSRKLPSLVQVLDCYSLFLFHVGGDEITMCSPRAIKRDFSILESRKCGAQIIFSPILAGTDPVYPWLAPWLGSQPEFGVFWQWDDQQKTGSVCVRWDSDCPYGQEGLCSWAIRADWQALKQI